MTTLANDRCEPLKTAAGFVDAVNSSTPVAFAEMAAGLTETERKKLSKAAQDLLQKARAGERENHGLVTHAGHMARLALLAVGPRGQTCRPMRLDQRPLTVGMFSIRTAPGPNPYEEAAVRILIDRRPEWADDWLACQLTDRENSLSWETVRRLIREGVCRKPNSAAYLWLVADFGRSADFDQDPDVLEDLWEFLRVPTGAFYLVAQATPGEVAKWKEFRGQNWPQIFYYLVHQGRIERRRLLNEILQALWGEFKPSERAGLMQFHNLLAPTQEELLGRQAAYIELLRNPAAPVVTFALAVIKSLANAESFDTAAALEALPAVFTLKSKAQPKSALSLLKTLVKRRPELTAQAIDVALQAVLHAESDVQSESLKCLEEWREHGLPAEKLLGLRGLVSPVARPKLDQLCCGMASASMRTTEDKNADTCAAPLSISQLRDRIALISSEIQAIWKLQESLCACQSGEIPPPADIDASRFVLAGLNTVTPIADADELIDAVGHALETIDSPMDVERILDGISRFGLERRGDFMARTDALRKRIRQVDPQMRMNSLLAARFIEPLFDLLEHWLGIGPGAHRDWLWAILALSAVQPTIPVYELLGARPKWIGSRLLEAKSGPLLSLPTHEHGWIDPRTFVDRLQRMPSSEIESSRPDLICGLLRLAPDFRDDALHEAASLPGPVGRIVRYALGDSVSPTAADQSWKAEWLAAGRARSPRGRLDELDVLDLLPAANAIAPAAFRVRLDRVPADSEQRKYRYGEPEAYIEIEPAGPTKFRAAEYPMLVITQRLARSNDIMFGGLPAWMEAWLASMWPSNTEPFLVGAIQKLLLRLDSPASSWDGLAAAPSLSPLLRAERAWPPAAIYALWLAMFSRDNDARAVAIDALVEGLFDGRAHPEPLAEVLIEIAGYSWAKLNRLGEGLREVARISPWGSAVIARILGRLIASWSMPPRDAHHILELQLELLIAVGGQLSEAARTPLKTLAGGSKTTRLAKRLLELDGTSDSAAYRSALLEGLDRRIARAEHMYPSSRSGTGRVRRVCWTEVGGNPMAEENLQHVATHGPSFPEGQATPRVRSRGNRFNRPPGD